MSTTPEEPIKNAAISLILGAIITTLLWNYGATEIIEALGGPDANVNIVDGALASWFLSSVAATIKRGGFPA